MLPCPPECQTLGATGIRNAAMKRNDEINSTNSMGVTLGVHYPEGQTRVINFEQGWGVLFINNVNKKNECCSIGMGG